MSVPATDILPQVKDEQRGNDACSNGSTEAVNWAHQARQHPHHQGSQRQNKEHACRAGLELIRLSRVLNMSIPMKIRNPPGTPTRISKKIAADFSCYPPWGLPVSGRQAIGPPDISSNCPDIHAAYLRRLAGCHTHHISRGSRDVCCCSVSSDNLCKGISGEPLRDVLPGEDLIRRDGGG